MPSDPRERSESKVRAVFLDRDGVVTADRGDRLEKELVLLPGSGCAIARLNEAGWTVVVVTNQPAVARGLVPESRVEEERIRLESLLSEEGAHIAGFFYCPHHPKATVLQYRVECTCRKPLPGMLEEAGRMLGIDLRGSVMVGDRGTDIEAGHRAGCAMTILVESGAGAQPRIMTSAPPLDVTPTARVADLGAAVRYVLAHGES